MGGPVFRLQVNRARELLEGCRPTALLQEAPCSLIMSLDKARVDLQSAAIGDVGLGILALLKIEVALLEVLQLAHMRVTRAASHKRGQEKEKPVGQNQTRLAPERRRFREIHRQLPLSDQYKCNLTP